MLIKNTNKKFSGQKKKKKIVENIADKNLYVQNLFSAFGPDIPFETQNSFDADCRINTHK